MFVDANNKIRITLRNMTRDITLANIYYRIECYDTAGNPFICNKDGESTYFEGNYGYLVEPLERTAHGSFNFHDYVIDRPLGAVALIVTGWKDSDGYSWTIPESERVRTTWTKQDVPTPGEGVG